MWCIPMLQDNVTVTNKSPRLTTTKLLTISYKPQFLVIKWRKSIAVRLKNCISFPYTIINNISLFSLETQLGTCLRKRANIQGLSTLIKISSILVYNSITDLRSLSSFFKYDINEDGDDKR